MEEVPCLARHDPMQATRAIQGTHSSGDGGSVTARPPGDRPRPGAAVVVLALVAALLALPAGAAVPVLQDPTASEEPLIHEPYNETNTYGSIQPGAMVEPVDGSGWCTLNFVLTDGEDYYVGTAGHCFEVGTPVEVGGETVGEVVYAEAEGIGQADWGFIEVDEEDEDEIDPTVRYWRGPIKAPVEPAGDVARAVQPQTGDPLFHYGWGIGIDDRAREGVTALWTISTFRFVGEVAPGDSGSPVLNSKGQAVGIVTAVTPMFAIGSVFQQGLFALESHLDREVWLVPGEPFAVGNVGDVGPGCGNACAGAAPFPPTPDAEPPSRGRLLPGAS